jgi:L-ribulose-5-phosphate 3-epimerase
MKIGILINLKPSTDIFAELQKVKELNLDCCQLCCWSMELYTRENAKKIKDAVDKTGIEITAVWAGWSGQKEWNFYGGPLTLGLIPSAYRHLRMQELMKASDFAEHLGVTDVITHVGFLPENPNDPVFSEVVVALRYIAEYMKPKGQFFLFETGQETPVTLIRTIETVGTGNLGINFDMANLILYGKANPADAIDIFGKYIRNTHFKDGEYPTSGTELGEEKPLGQGKVNVPLIIKKLKECGYQGPLTIEREISGEEQMKDIISARNIIVSALNSL